MKKVLFFTYDFPYPVNSGGKNRAFNLIKHGKKDLEIHLFSFSRSYFKEEYKKELEKIGVTSITVFPRKKAKSMHTLLSTANPRHSVFHHLYFDASVQKELYRFVEEQKIDVLHFESFYTSFYAHTFFSQQNIKQIYGSENIEYTLYDDYAKYVAKPLLKPFYKNEARKIKHEEKSFCTTTDVTIAVTREEAQEMEELGAKKTHVIPNGVDITEFSFKPKKNIHGSKILFVGNFSYFPNRDAISFFYLEVFQLLQKEYTLTLVGKDVKKLKISNPRVHQIDFIPDIRDVYYDADIMISPIRIGGGTNFKLLEAAACGLPIIAHPSRVESLGFVPDEHILTADSSEEFVEKTERLLNNDGLQGKLAKNAREHIEQNYSWEIIGKKINRIWQEL